MAVSRSFSRSDTLPQRGQLRRGIWGAMVLIAAFTAGSLGAAEFHLAQPSNNPLANPDGRERYLQAFVSRRGRDANPDPASSEHWEPWPGGRVNHYLVDLNRDWAWLTQQETRVRLGEYRRWEPQVHVDLHEMNRDSTYFFPPPAEPVHPAIDRRVLSWIERFGQTNADTFQGHFLGFVLQGLEVLAVAEVVEGAHLQAVFEHRPDQLHRGKQRTVGEE